MPVIFIRILIIFISKLLVFLQKNLSTIESKSGIMKVLQFMSYLKKYCKKRSVILLEIR